MVAVESFESQRLNHYGPGETNPVTGYVITLFNSLKTEKTVKQVKERLIKYSEQNGMSFEQVRTAELNALSGYNGADSSFISSNVVLEPEILDFIKYIRVLDILNSFDHAEKIRNGNKKWDIMVRSLAHKMNDVNYAVLRNLLMNKNLGLHKYITDIFTEESKLRTLYDDNCKKNNRLVVSQKSEIAEPKLPVYRKSDVKIVYKDEEILHYALRTQMIKKSKRTIAVGYHGPQISIRIMRGLRYKAGIFKPAPMKEEYWDTESEGSFFITNQRIGFIGLKSFSFPLTKLFYLRYEDEVLYVFKEGRENPFIVYIPRDMVDEPLYIISELINR